MNSKSIITLIVVLFSVKGFTQIPSDFEQQTDTIFNAWEDSNKPGIASGIIKDGKVIYLKGFGTANLETKELITPQTKFQVDDLSKQFTALSILLLEEQGKISMNDDIRKYIPQLPSYSSVISINHVLNHTTGLDYYSVLHSLLGGKSNDIFTHDDALALISNQKQLNFVPGTNFSYHTSDTESTLMAEIVAEASGQSLAEFADDYIFKPLKMYNTLFCEDYETIIPNAARSYQPIEGEYKKRVLNKGNAGPTNLYISAEDLAIWYAQFSKTKTNPLAKTIQKLHSLVTLDSGTINNHAWGKMSWARDFIHAERGIYKYWQYGLLGSYGANMFLYPEQDLTGFAIGNNNQYNGYYAMVPLEPLLKDDYKAPPVVDFSTIETKILSTKKLKKFEGVYWDFKGSNARKVWVQNDTLGIGFPGSDRFDPIVPLSDNTFQAVVNSDDIIIFKFKNDAFEVTSGESDPTHYKKYMSITYSVEELQQFVGTYYNESLNSVFNLSVKDGELITHHIKNGTIIFSPAMKDVFRGDKPYFKSIFFIRSNNKIKGFKIKADGIENLEFKKIDFLPKNKGNSMIFNQVFPLQIVFLC